MSADRLAPPLTTPDLVVLGLLLERPMYGYEVLQELAHREVQDWAEVSRPQVYYSLRKLAERGVLTIIDAEHAPTTPARGPDRRTYRVTASGRRAYAKALTRAEWTTERRPTAFRTWLVLAVHAPTSVLEAQVARRRAFLEREIARERQSRVELAEYPGANGAVARLIVDLAIRQFETELKWLVDAVTPTLAQIGRA
jgi:DNA-binding PadR family transcriptional regulator